VSVIFSLALEGSLLKEVLNKSSLICQHPQSRNTISALLTKINGCKPLILMIHPCITGIVIKSAIP